jgi:PKD repeat protein
MEGFLVWARRLRARGIAGIFGVVLAAAGMISLVCFALAAPEPPPEQVELPALPPAPAPVDTGGEETGAGTVEAAPVTLSSADNRAEAAVPPASDRTPALRVSYAARSGNDGPVVVYFAVDEPSPERFQSFEWDLGDGSRSFRADPIHEYATPKTYTVRLIAKDAAGLAYRSTPLYVDVPRPGSAAEYSAVRFVTLPSPEDPFEAEGVITAVNRYAGVEAAPLDADESEQPLTRIRFKRPGFYGLTLRETGGNEQRYSIFVSPLPTAHSDAGETDFDWYRTQFGTGTTSNCGPASAAMAIAWSTGVYFPVSSVRQAVGWQGEGGTSFEELLAVIKAQGIPAGIAPIRGAGSVRDVIDAGGIAVALFRTDGVRTAAGNPAQDLFGKYYDDSVGHYVVIKGYSLDGEYFVIYDPLPSDWSANSFRYGDEMSMMGRNRYYRAAELIRSLRRADMIVVSKPAARP